MTDDKALPPDESPASEEETQAANALREALEGRRAGTHLPEPALETAALLRFGTDAGQLSSERARALRAELLASLPGAPAKKARRGLWHWLGLGVSLAGGVTAVVVLGVIGARQLSAPATREEARFSDARSVAAPVAAAPAEGAAAETPAAAAPVAAPLAPPPAPARAAANHADDRASEAEASSAARPRPAFAAAQREAVRLGSGAGAPGGAGALAARDREFAAAPAAMRADEAGAAAQQPAAKQLSAERTLEAKKTAPSPAARVPTEQVRRASDEYRAQLLAELADPRVDGAYGELDRAHSRAELEHAQTRLGALAAASFGNSSGDADRLRPDMYCRLAEVALRLGQPQAALDWARRGLALGAPASPFVARLYLLEGQAKDALGDRDGAARSYLKAIEINEQLLDESLGGR